MPEGKSERKITAKKSWESSFPKSALKQIKLPLPRLVHMVQYMGRWTDLFTWDDRMNLSIRYICRHI